MKCPNCGLFIPDNDLRCDCGYNFASAPTENIRCANCGAELRPEASYCVSCAVPQSAILVTGRINSIDEGSAAARFLIGFGAGRAKARGTFAIHDAGNKSLAKFQTWESYSGGAGIGGMDMVQMEEILERLGRETAKTVVRWSQGKDLRPPSVE